jgi:hypothetical protein
MRRRRSEIDISGLILLLIWAIGTLLSVAQRP